MATKTTVTLEDDLDGGPADETVRFGLGGALYEIDLSKKNARAFRKQLAPYPEHARKAGPAARRRPGAGRSQPPARQRHPGVGERSRHSGQRPWADPRQRGGAVPGRHPAALSHAQITAGANQSRPDRLRR